MTPVAAREPATEPPGGRRRRVRTRAGRRGRGSRRAWRGWVRLGLTLVAAAAVLAVAGGLLLSGLGDDDERHRLLKFLSIPLFALALGVAGYAAAQVVGMWRAHRSGGWGFDPASGLSWGAYHEEPRRSGRRRRSRTP